MNGARANLIVGILIGSVILLAVAVGILWCDARAAVSLVKQYRSTTFAQTTGRILSSNLRHDEGGRRSLSSYTVEVSYSYAVAGQTYQGKQYRTTITMSNREDGPRRIVSELPAGKEVTVYYDPADPAEAVLSPGLTPADFLSVHLLMPFNCPLLIVACVLWRLARARFHPAGGAAFVERGGQTRIRLHPLTAAEKALGITALISELIAVALMIFTDPFVSAAVAIAVWATVPLIFGVAYIYFRPRGYLVLDAREGLIKIPSGKQGEGALEIPWAQVTELRFAEQERTSAQGLTSVAYTVVLGWRNKRGHEKERTLIAWDSEYCTKRFFVWLYPRVMESARLPAKESGPSKIPPSPTQGKEMI